MTKDREKVLEPYIDSCVLALSLAQKIEGLKTLPAKAREVLSGPSTLPAFLVSGASVALVSVRARLLG
jgi:hypothetical protein